MFTGAAINPLTVTKPAISFVTFKLNDSCVYYLPDTAADSTRQNMYDQTCVMQLKPCTGLPGFLRRPPFRAYKRRT